jgi:electron transfer flavoprotein alpha subunit
MSGRFGPVWVVAEQAAGRLLSVSLQLIGHARKLADQLNTPLEVVLLGEHSDGMPAQLINAGADRVYIGQDPVFSPYHPQIFTETITTLCKENNPEIMLLGSTFMGRELAPLLAAKLGTGLTAHCIDLVLDENMLLEQKIPAYGGLMSIICPDHRPQMATVAKGVFPQPELDDSRQGEIIQINPPKSSSGRIEILEIVREEPEGVSLESASTVVAGGAGATDEDGWQEIVELAEVLNAGLGSTRPAVDAGWIKIDTMIGQSGKMVSPELYIGIGLSGEQQHMVGIVDAKVLVAVNIDPKSPVFDQVDFGIVADCREFIPILTEKLKEHKSKE